MQLTEEEKKFAERLYIYTTKIYGDKTDVLLEGSDIPVPKNGFYEEKEFESEDLTLDEDEILESLEEKEAIELQKKKVEVGGSSNEGEREISAGEFRRERTEKMFLGFSDRLLEQVS